MKKILLLLCLIPVACFGEWPTKREVVPWDGTNRINITTSGQMKTVGASGLSVSKGDIDGTTVIHKFGDAPDFDTGDNTVTVWDGADDGGINAMTYTYSTTADIDSVVSSDASDLQDIEIQGLGASSNAVTQTVTLNGQTRVALSTNLWRVFRMKNVGTSNFTGNVSCYITNSTISAGVVTASADVRAIVKNGNNQTLMAVYTVPGGKTGYMTGWFAATAGALKTSNYIIDMVARPPGKVFQLKNRAAISETGNSYIQHVYTEPKAFTEGTDIEMRADITAVGVTAASVSAGFDIILVDD